MNFTEFELAALKNTYEDATPETAEIKEVISVIKKEKSFRFSGDDVRKRFPLSVASGRLAPDGRIQAGKDFALSDHPINFYALWVGLSDVATYDFTQSLADLDTFIDKCRAFFLKDGIVPGGWTIENLRQFLFVATFRAGHYDPMSELALLSVDNPTLHLLYNLYFKNTSVWNYPFKDFWATAVTYMTIVGEPKPNVMDARSNNTIKAVLDVLDRQTDLSGPKATVLADMNDSPVGRMAEVALSWFDRKGLLKDEEILSWLVYSTKITSAIVVLNNRESISVALAEVLWERLLDLSPDETQRSLLYQLLVKILDKTHGLSEDLSNSIKNYLRSEVVKGEESQVIAMIYALQKYGNGRGFANEVISQIIALEPYLSNYNKAIAHYYHIIDDLKGFFSFLQRYAMQENRFFKLKDFKFQCDLFFDAYPSEYLHQVVSLLIDDWGMVRKVGGRLLSHYLHEQDRTGFQINPQEMDALQQYKFIVSATSHPLLLEESLRCLVPFLFVKSDIVIELTLCRLQVIGEWYWYRATKMIEPLLDSHPQKVEILARLNEVIERAADISNKKHAIIEFKAQFAYPHLLQSFFKFYGQKNTKAMETVRKNHGGISSMMQHVSIARGGGSIMPDGSINPLSSVSASIDLPSGIYRDPIGERVESYNFYTTNWANDFEPCKQIIYSSGNI